MMNHCQATHLFCAVLGFWEGNRLTAGSVGFTLVSGFADEAPVGAG